MGDFRFPEPQHSVSMGAFLGWAILGLCLGVVCQECPRFAIGSDLQQPSSISSVEGRLNVTLLFSTRQDGNVTYFCYHTEDGKQSPTLRVQPGDLVEIHLQNNLDQGGLLEGFAVPLTLQCGSGAMFASSINLHFHGLPISPTCRQDQVFTIVNGGETFTYEFHIPLSMLPGMYAAHAHMHGLAEKHVQGGSSFVIIVEGMERFKPEIGGLPERIIAVRDEPTPVKDETDHKQAASAPEWDISTNYAPIPFPNYDPPVIRMRQGQSEFWRVINLNSGSILNVRLLFDGVPQSLRVVALDGVPLNSNRDVTTIPLGNLARAEFIVTAPTSQSVVASLITFAEDTGPEGDLDPTRPLAQVVVDNNAIALPVTIPRYFGAPIPISSSQLQNAKPTKTFTLFFSENEEFFFLTLDGETPQAFSPFNAPTIIVADGDIVRMRIENRAKESHVFHIHQIHFLPVLRNDQPVSPFESHFLDTITIPFWSGLSSDLVPSVTLMMEFGPTDVGTFVLHCHILEHEDNGMMGLIEVLPRSSRDEGGDRGGKSGEPDWKIWLAGVSVGIVGFAVIGAVAFWALRRTQKSKLATVPMSTKETLL
eukprot:c1217_g1_i2.p1 GENE.c1217_g1_i2~~c1217_g1_i2.p1  ORF type:complete len:592 (+),score=125.04 c1217_g1_i2:11-1786(+)